VIKSWFTDLTKARETSSDVVFFLLFLLLLFLHMYVFNSCVYMYIVYEVSYIRSGKAKKREESEKGDFFDIG